MSKEFMRLFVNESVLKSLAKGSTCELVVDLMCRKLIETLAGKHVKTVVLSAALEEASNIAKAVLVLCGELRAPSDADIQTLAFLTGAHGLHSSAALVKHCLAQTPFWAAREKRIREQTAAWKMFKPEIACAKETLSTLADDLEPLVRMTSRLVAWREALDEGGPWAV